MQLEQDANIVLLETDFGTMEILLFDNTPKHKRNFTELVKKRYYDGSLFHRIISSFVIQGGESNSKATSADSYSGKENSEHTIAAEFNQENLHFKGAIAAARTSDMVNPQKRSSGSQFYIVQGRAVTDDTLDKIEKYRQFEYSQEQRSLYKLVGGTPHLDLDYTVFGKVISGLEVIDTIAAVSCNRHTNRPLEDVRMRLRLKK